MIDRRPILSLLASLCLALPAADAARADVVTTKDGIVLEGAVAKQADGTLVVATENGAVRLAADAVASVKAGDGPRTQALRAAAAVKPGDVEGHYRLALQFEASGLADLARRELEAVVAAEPDHAAARRALSHERVEGRWVSADEAKRHHGLVLFGGKWMLPEEAEAAASAAPPAVPAAVQDGTLAKAMRVAATGEPALAGAATLAVAKAPREDRLAVATGLLYDRDPKVRSWAAGRLAEVGDESSLRPLILSGLRDADPDVRRSAVLAAAAFGNDDVAVPYVRELFSKNPGMVVNAANALGTLGDDRAIVYLVKRIVSHGSSTRNYVAFLNKISYIRDYEVEIAQASNIANPVIGEVVEGIVLDAKVIDVAMDRTIVESVLVGALNALAGTSLRSREDVAAWFAENGDRLRDFAPTPSPRKTRAAH